MKRILVAIMIAASTLFLSSTSRAEEAITVRLKWLNQAQFAGYYVAKEKGYYDESGLDVSIQPGGSNFPAIQMVAGGSEQFGVTGADQILLARGKGVPVVALAVIYRKDPFVLFSLRSSGIDNAAKFRGKTIGVKIGGNEELIYRAVLKQAGVAATELSEVPVQFDLTPLLTHQVDVWPGYVINEVLAVQEKGLDTTIISPSDYGVSLYADTLFTTEKMLQQHPDTVRAFVAATLKGWTEAIADPDEAARITIKYGDHLTYDHEFAMMKASIAFLKPDAEAVGTMDMTGWTAMQTLLLGGGFLKAPVDLGKAYTTQFAAP